jgi:hypothetical protein
MSARHHTNQLINETSPYLLQHAHNPVDWFPWGDEALNKARAEDKPIMLSIGYSACHWCHVMEHESFEDEEVAKVMNELFVCIKVDREERPDLDKIYQTSHQILTQRSGGWPLNMFLTPTDHMPFFGGTYFPKDPRYGMPAFTDILSQVADAYREKRVQIEEQNKTLQNMFLRIQPQRPDADQRIDGAVLNRAYSQLAEQFDSRYGGFGGAPKFPHPTSVEFLMRYWAGRKIAGQAAEHALKMAVHTLRAMAQGGLYDQLGGGFCRYSVDERWLIPHFEKMLYDNAQLIPLYVDAWRATGDSFFRRIAIESAEWIKREMQSPGGGYYSTLDADSEGHEGKYYVWTREEIKSLLTPPEWEVTEARFRLDASPNFEGRYHLFISSDTAAIANKFECPESEVIKRLDSARAKLFEFRETRIRPGRDEKILTSWNGLMIKAMARAGRALERQDLIASAEQAFDFVRSRLWNDGRLRVTEKDGRAQLNAYLDDYVFMIDAGLELLQARWRAVDMDFMLALTDVVLERFEDREHGAFYFTADDHEKLVHRPKPTADEAIPSGNGVAAQVLLRLGHLLGKTRYLDAAERVLRAMYPSMDHYPSAHASLLVATEEYLEPTQSIVVRGSETDLARWHARCMRHYAPQRLTLAIPDSADKLSGLLAARAPGKQTLAYICSGQTCQMPVTVFTDLDARLAASEVSERAPLE